MENNEVFMEEHNDEYSYSTSDYGTGTGTETSVPAPVNETAKEPRELQLAASDTSRIKGLRLALILATLAIGAAVTTITFVWLKKANQKQSQNAVWQDNFDAEIIKPSSFRYLTQKIFPPF